VKYLDLPLGASFKANSIWDGIIEKVSSCACLKAEGLP
jgi:hypothetical protein